MVAQILKHTSLWMTGFSAFMHLFCCGLPLLLSLISLSTVAGAAGSPLISLGWFARNEPYIMVVSGALLLLTGGIMALSARLNCRSDGHCVHPPCDTQKDHSKTIFIIAVALYTATTLLQFLSA